MKRRAVIAGVLLLIASAAGSGQEAPAVFVLPTGDAVAIVLGDTGRSVQGFVVSRRDASGTYRMLTEQPVTAAADPYAAAALMGDDFRWLASRIGSVDPPTVWRQIRADRSRADAFALVSHGLRRALGRTYIDTEVRAGRRYAYRVLLLDASMRTLRRVDVAVTAGEPAEPSPAPAVSCEAGDREVTVTWDYPAYAGGDDVVVGFHVYRARAGGEARRLTAAPVLRADGYLAWFDESVENGVRYTYTVTAVDIIGTESAGTSAPPVRPADTEPPLVPSGVAAVDTDDGVRVVWNISPNLDVDHYDVLRSRRSDEGFERVSRRPVPYDDPVFVDTGIVRGVTWYYKVVAVDSAGNESAPGGPAHVSPRDSEPPGPIAGLQALLDEERRAVALSWEASPEADLRGYFVYRGESRDSLIRLTPSPAFAGEEAYTDAGYEDRGLFPGASVVYAVSAVDLSYNEGPPVYAGVEVPDNVAPDAPFSLSARLDPDGTVRLAWMVRREEQITRFVLYRAADGVTEVIARPEGGETRWTDAQAARGVRCEYRVIAVDAAGNESERSQPVTVVPTDIVAPDPPGGVRVRPVDDGAAITWEHSPSPDLAGYLVDRIRYAGARPERLTESPVVGETFTDSDARPGMSYAVRAVDTSGNTSAAVGPVPFEEGER